MPHANHFSRTCQRKKKRLNREVEPERGSADRLSLSGVEGLSGQIEERQKRFLQPMPDVGQEGLEHKERQDEEEYLSHSWGLDPEAT